jgi:hypothetical protein
MSKKEAPTMMQLWGVINPTSATNRMAAKPSVLFDRQPALARSIAISRAASVVKAYRNRTSLHKHLS